MVIEESIEESSTYNNTIIDNISEPLIIFNTDTQIIQYINNGFVNSFKKTPLSVNETRKKFLRK